MTYKDEVTYKLSELAAIYDLRYSIIDLGYNHIRYLLTTKATGEERFRVLRRMLQDHLLCDPKLHKDHEMVVDVEYDFIRSEDSVNGIINFVVDHIDENFVFYNYKEEPSMPKRTFTYSLYPEIDRVIYNDPATIVFWKDGTKTVVKAQNCEYNPALGLAMCFIKRTIGLKEFLKHLPKETEIEDDEYVFNLFYEKASEFFEGLSYKPKADI